MKHGWIRRPVGWLSIAWVVASLAACGRTKPVHDAATPPDAAPPETGAVGGVVPAVRQQDYTRQHTVTLPASFPAEVRALLPALPHKLVAFALERNMARTKPAPGRRKAMVRFVSPAEQTELIAALGPHFQHLGWRQPDPGLRAPLHHPTLGRLTVEVTSRPDSAVRIELTVEGTQPPDSPLENPLTLLHRPMDWLDDAAGTIVGYELGHYHAVRFGGSTTDLQRVAIQVRLPEPGARDALLLRLPDRVEQAGFRLEAKESGLYRGEDGGMFSVQPGADAHELIIHHQQRWTRLAPP